MKHNGVYEKVIRLACILLLASFPGAGVKAINIDSLKAAWKKNKLSDTSAITWLKHLAIEMQGKGDYKKSLEVSEEIKRLSTRFNYPVGIGHALKIAGEAYLNMNEYENASQSLERAQLIFNDFNLPLNRAYALNALGRSYAHRGQYESALKRYDKVLDILIRFSDQKLEAIVLNNIGNVYFNKGSYEKALEYYFMSLKAGTQLQGASKFIQPLNNIGVVHAKLSQTNDALRYFLSFLEEMGEGGSKRDKANVLLNIGEIYIKQRDFGRAMQYLDSAVQIQSEINDRRGLALSYCNLASAYRQLGNSKQAHHFYDESISLARGINEMEVLLNPLLGLSSLNLQEGRLQEIEKAAAEARSIAISIKSKTWLEQAFLLASRLDSAKGNYKKAYSWLTKYLPLHDSLFNDQKTHYVIQMREQYETEKKEKEIQLLNEAKKFGELRQANQWTLFWITSLFLVLVIGCVFYWGRVKARNSRILEMQKERIARSNSELRFLIEKVEQQNKTLYEMHQEKDAFIGIVAHDLRSPLSRIKGLSNIVSMHGALNEEQMFLMQNIQKVCEDGTNLIRDLLEINEYETAIQKPEFIEIDVAHLVKEMVRNFSTLARNKKISLWFEYDTMGEFTIWADSSYVSRVLENLISNAIKFSPFQSNVYVDVTNVNGEVQIAVRDEGPGFNQDDLPHLFKKFKKLSARPTAGEPSTGLGLSIVKVLMERLGGHVEVKTKPGLGATFLLTFQPAASYSPKPILVQTV